VAKVSSQWKQIRYWLSDSSFDLSINRLAKLAAKKSTRKLLSLLLTSLALTAMLAWNWKLVLATGSGVGLMLLVYSLQAWNWRAILSYWRQFFSGSHGKLATAVGSGGFAALGTYIAASLWADSENRWLALGSILQGLGTLLTIVLLIWHSLADRHWREDVKFERSLHDLTATEALKRLIAVQRLANLYNKSFLDRNEREQLVEYFCLMLTTEKDNTVRDAIWKSLQAWGLNLPKSHCDRPLQIPLDLQPSIKRFEKQI
jgi:hypothetical protein